MGLGPAARGHENSLPLGVQDIGSNAAVSVRAVNKHTATDIDPGMTDLISLGIPKIESVPRLEILKTGYGLPDERLFGGGTRKVYARNISIKLLNKATAVDPAVSVGATPFIGSTLELEAITRDGVSRA